MRGMAMYQTMLQSTFIEQEKRAIKLFLLLLLTVVFATDLFLTRVFKPEQESVPLYAYLSFIAILPIVVYFLKKEKPAPVKYALFFTYTLTNFSIDIVIFWDKGEYFSGNIAEIYFILFSPIFVNHRFCYTVITVTTVKYLLSALLFETVMPFGAIGLILIFAIVAIIIFCRFNAYVKAINTSIINQFESVVRGIISMIELKDPYTKGHSLRVAEYANLLARTLNVFSEEELSMIYQACLLHDVGKIHVPDSILSKPGPLTDEEMDMVKKHPEVGLDAIKSIHGTDLFKEIVLYHHERWDGKGYPEGIREKKIPLAARIVALADSFDAMTTDRSYRKAMTPDEAMEEIRKGKGTQFDPALVEYTERIFADWKNMCLAFREKQQSAGAGHL